MVFAWPSVAFFDEHDPQWSPMKISSNHAGGRIGGCLPPPESRMGFKAEYRSGRWSEEILGYARGAGSRLPARQRVPLPFRSPCRSMADSLVARKWRVADLIVVTMPDDSCGGLCKDNRTRLTFFLKDSGNGWAPDFSALELHPDKTRLDRVRAVRPARKPKQRGWK